MQYLITITGSNLQRNHEMYIRASKGATPEEVAKAYNAAYPTRCIEVKHPLTHKTLWKA